MALLNASMCPVVFTEAAKTEISKIYTSKNIPPEYGLRIAVEGGGCAAVSFIIGFDKQSASDKTYEMENVNIFIDKKHQMFLFGVKVDYVSNAEEQGFEFGSV